MAKLRLVIGNKNYSSWSLRPWLALRAAEASFDEQIIWLDGPTTKGEILRHSRAGRVPVLHDGNVTIWESLAICEYVAERFPGAQLWPEDPAARAHARAVSAEMHAGFEDLRRELPMDIRRREPRNPSTAAWANIERVNEIWREARHRFGDGGPFLYGSFCVADCMFAPVVTRFVTYGVELDVIARAYQDAVLTHPHMQAWTQAALGEPELPG